MTAGSDRAIIFDLDGTLWDTLVPCARGWNRALAKHSETSGRSFREITPEDIRGIMGLTAEEVRIKLLGEFPEEEGRMLQRACFDQEIVEIDRIPAVDPDGNTFYPGVRECIPRLAQSHALYIVSNCDGPYLDAFFRVSRMREYFRDAECHGNTGLPKGENIRLILSRNQLERAIYVGDTVGDQKAAQFANLPFVYARYGFGECARFDAVIDSFKDLEHALGGGV